MQSHVEIIPGPTVAPSARPRVQIFHGAGGAPARSSSPQDPLQAHVEVTMPAARAGAAASRSVDPLAQLEEARARAEQAKDEAERRIAMLDAAIAGYHTRVGTGSGEEAAAAPSGPAGTSEAVVSDGLDVGEQPDAASGSAEESEGQGT